jgi:thiamine-phosphate pyrophosphorylase
VTTALATAHLYLVAPARVAAGPVAELVGDLAAAGVDVLQLREKHLEAGDLLRVGEPLAHACADAGIPFIVNDRPDVAALLGAGVHVGQNDLSVEHARRFVTDGVVGLSTHARAEIDAALDVRPDYIAVGPVFDTPTKPGRAATGLDLVRYAAASVDLPWFAIGGIDPGNMPEVLEAGARRVVVVRAITEASDPIAAAARLRALLDDARL